MAITHVGDSEGTTGTTSFPSASVVGDFIVLQWAGGSLPSGWTLVRSDGYISAAINTAYRVRQSGDTAPTITGAAFWSMAAFRGVGGVETASGSQSVSNGTGTAVTNSGVTTAVAGSLVIIGSEASGGNFVATNFTDEGFTTIGTDAQRNGGSIMYNSWQVYATAGATGSLAASWTNSSNWVCHVVTFYPAPSGWSVGMVRIA